MRKRLAILGLLVGGLVLFAAFDAALAALPAIGMSAVAAWLMAA